MYLVCYKYFVKSFILYHSPSIDPFNILRPHFLVSTLGNMVPSKETEINIEPEINIESEVQG